MLHHFYLKAPLTVENIELNFRQLNNLPLGQTQSLGHPIEGTRMRDRVHWSKTGGLMDMHNPAHPGEIIRELCLEPLGLGWQ